VNAALKVVAVLVFLAGMALEGGRLLRAPGFALSAGALLAVYLWFLANTRRRVGPPL
jgi:hypothetical protein